MHKHQQLNPVLSQGCTQAELRHTQLWGKIFMVKQQEKEAACHTLVIFYYLGYPFNIMDNWKKQKKKKNACHCYKTDNIIETIMGENISIMGKKWKGQWNTIKLETASSLNNGPKPH